jgi:hypothetical protein
MQAILRTYKSEFLQIEQLVDLPDDYDWGGGPYQKGFVVGSNQTLFPIADVQWPVYVSHGSPELENEESICEVEHFDDRVEVIFNSGFFTIVPIDVWYRFLRDKDTGIYRRQFPDGVALERLKAYP